MEPVAVVILVVALVVAVGILIIRRRPHQDDGMHNFRRHIDALSPESRREVMDRARRHEQAGPPERPGASGRIDVSRSLSGDVGRPGTADDDGRRGPDAAAAGGAADGNI